VRNAWALLAPLFLACSDQTPTGTIVLVEGGETGVFTQPPAPVTLKVDAIDQDGGATNLVTTSLPTSDTLNLPDQNQDDVASIRVTGLDDAGVVRVYGESLSLQYGALAEVDLQVFVQRTGAWARMPDQLDPRQAPLVGLLGGRYIFLAGGFDPGLDASVAENTELYDLANLQALTSPPTLPVVPASWTYFGTVGLFIDPSGNNATFDFSDSTSGSLQTPAGGTFADVAGGTTVFAPDGSSYILGGTRTTGPATGRVLYFDTNGNPSFLNLAVPRLGAAATWVSGPLSGVVVAGGVPAGVSGAGVEILTPGGATGLPLCQYPADTVVGAGAAQLDGTHVVLAGGTGPSGKDGGLRVVDLACGSGTTLAAWPPLALPLPTAAAFPLTPSSTLVVGDDPDGGTHTYVATADGGTEVFLHDPRVGGRGLALPTGQVVVVGGGSLQVESFTP
jgi:hypothetical protein